MALSSSRPSPAKLALGVVILLMAGAAALLRPSSPANPSSTPAGSGAPIAPAPDATPEPARAHASSASPAPASTPKHAPASSPKTNAAPLVVGSWNIEWLGAPDRRSGRAEGVAQSAADLAGYITHARVDILALQEIIATSGDANKPRSAELDAAFARLRQSGGATWDYVLFPGRQAEDQLSGVAWNSARAMPIDSRGGSWDASDAPWALPIAQGRSSQGSGLWNRPPHAMKFTAGRGMTDLVIVSLHMKSDFDGSFADHRTREAEVLAQTLDTVRRTFADDDILLIGDTNITGADEETPRVFASKGFTDLNAGSVQTHWRGGSTDRAFAPAAQPEFAASNATFRAVWDEYLSTRRWKPQDFKQHLSDHAMIVLTVDVRRDDD